MTSGRELTARVVLLGASNLARSLPVWLSLLPRTFPGERLDILLAHGHGRSYGKSSSIPGRTLPSILDCGLWPALEARPALPTYVLITDVGNDLGYGFDPETILGWVQTCLNRLQAYSPRTVLTGLPTVSLARLDPWQLMLFQWLFFPFAEKRSWLEVQQIVWTLERRLRDFARARLVAFVEPRPSWYALDPIHIRSRAREEAFRTFFSRWQRPAARRSTGEAAAPRGVRPRLLLMPEKRWLLGREQGRPQPSERLGHWGELSIY